LIKPRQSQNRISGFSTESVLKKLNYMPEEIKLCDSKNIFNGLAKTFFRDRAAERLSA
jgi:hypothetical protein